MKWYKYLKDTTTLTWWSLNDLKFIIICIINTFNGKRSQQSSKTMYNKIMRMKKLEKKMWKLFEVTT